MKWFVVIRAGVETAPITESELHRMIEVGMLGAEDRVRSVDTGEVSLASEFPQAGTPLTAWPECAIAMGPGEYSTPPPPLPAAFPDRAAGNPSSQLQLWNPAVAAYWSLLFSPVFGAWLHAQNWRTLGAPDKAKACQYAIIEAAVWMLVTVPMMLRTARRLDQAPLTLLLPVVMVLFLAIKWYLELGREQVRYVKAVAENQYTRKEWGLPVLFACAAGLVYWGAFLVMWILVAAYKSLPPR